MARNIVLNQDGGYRAVHIFTDFQGKEHTVYEGIYNKEGTAKARVSFWRNYLEESFVDGWVEYGEIPQWERVK